MLRIGLGICLLILTPLAAQMSERQKISDLESLASIYAKNYGPYDWKKAAFDFDLFDLRPWVERVKATSDDYEYFDVLMEYVASLRDGHTTMLVPSSFSANLGFTVDIYDGRVLIDSITRSALPQVQFPFVPGDELVSVDNVPAEDVDLPSAQILPGGQRAQLAKKRRRGDCHAKSIPDSLALQTGRHRGSGCAPRKRGVGHLLHQVAEVRQPGRFRRSNTGPDSRPGRSGG